MEPTRLTLPASAESISAFREFVRGGAVAAGVAAEQLEKLDLVLEEILINVARYAYSHGSGTVEVAYAPAGPRPVAGRDCRFRTVFSILWRRILPTSPEACRKANRRLGRVPGEEHGGFH